MVLLEELKTKYTKKKSTAVLYHEKKDDDFTSYMSIKRTTQKKNLHIKN